MSSSDFTVSRLVSVYRGWLQYYCRSVSAESNVAWINPDRQLLYSFVI